MATDDVSQSIDALCAALVLADTGDAESIVELRRSLESVHARARDAADDGLARVCAVASDRIERAKDPADIVEAVREAVEGIRAAQAAQTSSANPFQGDPDLTTDFIVEAREHVDSVEENILQLESDGHDAEALNGLFRAFHSVKGVALLLELEDIAELARQTEELLDAVRGDVHARRRRPHPAGRRFALSA